LFGAYLSISNKKLNTLTFKHLKMMTNQEIFDELGQLGSLLGIFV